MAKYRFLRDRAANGTAPNTAVERLITGVKALLKITMKYISD
jgi:hypothetical protein